MRKKEISPIEFSVKIQNIWSKQWLLLTCGDYEKNHFNAMTVGWGSLGVMWNKPFAQVVVRPTRYTYEFMNQYNDFTLTAYPEKYRSALQLLGSRSGREGDKISDSGLTAAASQTVKSPTFLEAELSIECITIYRQDMDPKQFLDSSVHRLYNNDYHRIYFGEISKIVQLLK